MIIITNGRQNPKGYEWAWFKTHRKQLRYAISNKKCPGCGRSLGSRDMLIDLGFDVGIECEYCR